MGLVRYSSTGPTSHAMSCGGLWSLKIPISEGLLLGRLFLFITGYEGVLHVYAGNPHIGEVTLGQHIILK